MASGGSPVADAIGYGEIQQITDDKNVERAAGRSHEAEERIDLASGDDRRRQVFLDRENVPKDDRSHGKDRQHCRDRPEPRSEPPGLRSVF